MSDAKAANLDFWVREPFLPNEYADIIIRSSDGHTFHVVKAILSLCSSVFKDMFSLPRPAATGDSLQTVDISESGAVTDILLRHIYPIEPPAIIGASLWSDVVSAARKYEMNRVVDAGKRAIRNLCSDVSPSALQAFVLSCTHHLGDEARLAAFESLRLPLREPSSIHILDSLPGRAVACLVIYHDRVGKRIIELFSDNSQLVSEIADAIDCTYCSSRFRNSHSRNMPKSWAQLCRNVERAVYEDGPLSVARQIIRDKFSLDCSKCETYLKGIGSVGLSQFIRVVIENAAQEVVFDLPWLIPNTVVSKSKRGSVLGVNKS